jgi:hypothetical protein
MHSLSFAKQMDNNICIAKDSLASAQDAQKVTADCLRQPASFQVGQKVYLSTQYLPLTYSTVSDQWSCKLQNLYNGPFKIVI